MACGRKIKTVDDLCMYLLEEAKIAVVPGSEFWIPSAVRFAYTDSMERLEEGMERFRNAMEKLQ